MQYFMPTFFTTKDFNRTAMNELMGSRKESAQEMGGSTIIL